MPGRQYSAPSAVQKPKAKKSKAKRSLNALAIAEKVAPAQKDRRQHRLGQLDEDSTPKRKRVDDDNDDDDGESSDRRQDKRSRKVAADTDDENVEVASDSSGNEWMTGRVDDDDDSELDSDEAFGDSDDDRFEGYSFRGGSSQGRIAQQKKKGDSASTRRGSGVGLKGEQRVGAADDDGEGEEEDIEYAGQDDDDSFGEDGVDLADMLDAGSQAGSEYLDDESDLQSILSMSEDNDAENESKLSSLKGLVESMQDKSQASPFRRESNALESLPPSEFGVTSRRKLTAADIMPTITDPAMRKSIKHLVDADKNTKKLKDAPRKLEAPLPKRQQDRIDRQAAYDKSKETLDRWVDTVKQNRRAEHLQFPLKDPDAAAPQGQNRLLPLTETRPLFELESTIQKIMQESGMVGADGKLSENQIQASEELETKKMPIQEVLARRAELRRQRDLLFREEIRAKRIKKIKSKTYRKIHRKERERNDAQIRSAMEADGEIDSEDEKERADRRRAEERMGAKHRESKWAKGIKSSGRSKWDDEARDGVLEMARRDEELRRRMQGKRVHGDDESDSFEDESDGSEEGDDAMTARSKLPSRVERLLRAGEEDNQKQSKLSGLGFMKKAEASQREQNEADLMALQREANGEGSASESDASEGAGRRAFGPRTTDSSRSRPAEAITQKREFEEPEPSEDEAAPQTRRRAEVDIDRVMIDAGHGSNATQAAVPTRNGLTKVDTEHGSRNKGSKTSLNVATVGKPSSNAVRSALKGSRAAEAARKELEKSSPPAESTEAAEALLHGLNGDDEDVGDVSSSEDATSIVMTNADLARRAFAGDDVLAQNFQDEKAELTREQDDHVVDSTLPGWGTWAGLGVSKRASRPRAHHRNIKKVAGVAAAKRQDAKLKDVIISEKRVKRNGKYLASQLPHPFETRAQYERSLRLPVGPEWTTKETFQGMTKPRVLMKQGVIAPMVKPMV